MKYLVKVNGLSVPVHTARVSALPLNKIWDGVQRPVEQTEEAYFVSFDLQDTATLTIDVAEDFSAYEIRPKVFRLGEKRTGNTVSLTVDKPMQFTFEPDGRHGILHIFVNPPAVRPSGDVLYFGPGVHKEDLIWLESNQTLYLEEGAVVYGVVYAKDAENIRIMGRGILDASPYRRGNDDHEGGREVIDALLARGFTPVDMKYYGNLVLNHCKNVLVEGVILRDAPMWSLITRNDSEDIVIDNVKLIGHWRYNADGIDICTSINVTVKNSFVRSFDDCFVARGAYLEEEYGDVEQVTVENCVFWCDWGKTIEVWCGQKPTTIRDVTIKDCYFIHLSSKALNITAWYGSNASVIENILFQNIYIDDEAEYEKLVVEKPGKLGYTPVPGFIPFLIHIEAEKLGVMQGLGTQICAPVDDYSIFRMNFRGITLDNIQCADKRLRTFVCAVAEDVLNITDVKAINCEIPFEIKTTYPGMKE